LEDFQITASALLLASKVMELASLQLVCSPGWMEPAKADAAKQVTEKEATNKIANFFMRLSSLP
jgi:hypothetical protein